MSNSNGALTLPLVNTGSVVDVTLQGAGARVTLFGGQGGQSVQVPVIPQGDWTISSGQDVVLGPRPDGQPHQLTGDLTIGNNGVLTLISTEVVVSSGHTISVEGTGQLIGEDASITADGSGRRDSVESCIKRARNPTGDIRIMHDRPTSAAVDPRSTTGVRGISEQ